MKQILIDKYLEYVNEFLTIRTFAEYHRIDIDEATVIIKMGKKYHEQKVVEIQETNNALS